MKNLMLLMPWTENEPDGRAACQSSTTAPLYLCEHSVSLKKTNTCASQVPAPRMTGHRTRTGKRRRATPLPYGFAMLLRMGAIISIKPQLRSWIEHNLDRGCPPQQLVEGMIAQRFDPPIAQGLVRAFVDARNAGVPVTGDTVRIDTPAEAYADDVPRIAAGHSIHTADRVVSVVARLSRPVIAVLANVLSAEECEQLIALARPRLRPSTVVDPATGENRVAEYRNSEGMFFSLCETPFIAALDARFSQIANLPVDHGEGLQVLRYAPGSHSTPHFDFLMPRNPTSEQSLRRSGQRVSSLVAYLNDVPGGGETIFPHAGLSICPRRGNAVYFEYCNSRGQVDAASLHAGAPVTAGEKWAVTKWTRERRFVPAPATDP